MTGEIEPKPSWDELDRLKALDAYEILDTPDEEDYDEIVKMAAEACNVPLSLISFVAGGRQWFKAKLGTDMVETSLDVSICSQAILQRDLFVVPDTTKDPRFSENALVKGDPNIRFYAGALLESPEGLPLGTVCVLDFKPRELSEREAKSLKSLAKQVMAQLELRRALKAKSKSEERLKLALAASGFVGTWDWNIVTDRVIADEQFVTAFGGKSHWSVEGAPLAEYVKAIHPDDTARVSASIKKAMTGETAFQEEYRLLQHDGSIRWIEARGRCQVDGAGTPVRFSGVAVDITRRKVSEQAAREAAERFQFMAESMPQKIWTATPQGNIDFFNQQWMEFTGLSFEQIRDWGWGQFIHPDDLDYTVSTYKEAIKTEVPFEMEQRFRRADGTYRWHLARGAPMRNSEGEVIIWMGSNTDIDDYRKLSESLSETAAKFRSLFDQSSVFAGIMNLDGILLEANKTSIDACGYGDSEVIGKHFWNCGWWRGSQTVRDDIRLGTKLAAAGTPFIKTLPFWMADGTERVVDFALHPMRNESGQIIFLHPTGIDVTERHRTQLRTEFLAQLTQKLSLVSDPMEINQMATHAIGQFLKTDRCYFLQVSFDTDRIDILPDWHVQDNQSLEGSYRLSDFGLPGRWEALKSGTVAIEDVHIHLWTKDLSHNYLGTEIVGCMMSPFIQEGKVVACLGISSKRARNWTSDEMALLESVVVQVWPLLERARVEFELRESEERFRAMSDNIAPLAWMGHPDGSIFWYNKRWYDYTGENLETMRGDGWVKVQDPEHLPHVIESWKKALADETPWEDTFPLRGVDGTYRWFLSRAFPIRDSEGKIKLWFGVNTDVTEMRATHAQLDDKATHLEALVQQRTAKLSETISELEAFSYSISHDMRSPLRTMVGYADILKEEFSPNLGAEGVEYLDRISNASKRMDQLIQDVLIFSRISQTDVILQPVNADSLIRDIIQTYPNLRPEFVEINIRQTLPQVKGNEALLTQCFSNLLDNAVKFVDPGVKATIEVWAENSPGRVKLLFKDNGIGMSKHNLNRIFEIFHRIGRRNDGTGIGLAIVRKAVEKMGGTTGVESELGMGSLFWLDLQASQ